MGMFALARLDAKPIGWCVSIQFLLLLTPTTLRGRTPGIPLGACLVVTVLQLGPTTSSGCSHQHWCHCGCPTLPLSVHASWPESQGRMHDPKQGGGALSHMSITP